MNEIIELIDFNESHADDFANRRRNVSYILAHAELCFFNDAMIKHLSKDDIQDVKDLIDQLKDKVHELDILHYELNTFFGVTPDKAKELLQKEESTVELTVTIRSTMDRLLAIAKRNYIEPDDLQYIENEPTGGERSQKLAALLESLFKYANEERIIYILDVKQSQLGVEILNLLNHGVPVSGEITDKDIDQIVKKTHSRLDDVSRDREYLREIDKWCWVDLIGLDEDDD